MLELSRSTMKTLVSQVIKAAAKDSRVHENFFQVIPAVQSIFRLIFGEELISITDD